MDAKTKRDLLYFMDWYCLKNLVKNECRLKNKIEKVTEFDVSQCECCESGDVELKKRKTISWRNKMNKKDIIKGLQEFLLAIEINGNKIIIRDVNPDDTIELRCNVKEDK